jgi:D-proline reductase (dithiol) PrdB
MVKPSRAVYVQHPFGYTFGDIHDRARQRRVLLDCMRAAEDITVPGSIVELPYKWDKDDLRDRQLVKQAH